MKKTEPANSIVPENNDGKSVDLEESVTAADPDEAMLIYKTACMRLLNPGIWHELTGPLSANFKPENDKQELNEKDFIMIDLPAPKNDAGEGHDWVQVESIVKNAEKDAELSLGLTLRPSVNPNHPQEGVAHFFDEDATSSFIIKKNATIITASYYGRNEKPNTNEAKLKDKIRNKIVATGALAGLSELQWTSLLKSFLKK